ncbi:hypothetical protein DFH09DRAFT_1124738 [Mycena vulgaris]|nr:hypothetical protein DFH09DRAFT_1124738 [Mycena vulgaris]
MATKKVVQGLRNPAKHRLFCIYGLYPAVCSIRRSTGDPPTFAPELLRATLEFLLDPRANEDFDTFMDRMVMCGCGAPPASMPAIITLDLLLTHLCLFMHEHLIHLTQAKFRTVRPGRPAERQPWPNSLADIGLDGRTPHQAVTLLLRWAERPPVGHAIFMILAGLARFWNPYAVEVLNNRALVGWLRDHLYSSVRFYIHPRPNGRWDLFERPIITSMGFINELSVLDVEWAARYPHIEQGLYDLAVPLVPLLIERGDGMRFALRWFSRVLDARRLHLPGVLPQPVITLTYDTDYWHARYQMTIMRTIHQCMHLSCPSDLTGAAVTTFCVRCCVVRYCSPSCQRAAWRAERLPHADVCDKIHDIRVKLGFASRARDPAKELAWKTWLDMRVENAAAGLKEYAVTETRCRAIWLHLLWLRRAKDSIPPILTHVKALRGQTVETVNRNYYIGSAVEELRASLRTIDI